VGGHVIGPYRDIQVAVLAGREALHPRLLRWAHDVAPRRWRVFAGSELPDLLACRRNRILQWFRDEGSTRWLLMIDDDMVPVARTEELLACRADVAAARAWARTGREAHPHGVSVSCVKISRRAVEAVPPPWFKFAVSADGLRPEGCECRYFWRKFHRAGFTPAVAGLVGHRMPVVVLPGSGEPGECRPVFLFESQLDHA
jgi:hypothetical protein